MHKHIGFIFMCVMLAGIILVRLYETNYDSSVFDGFAVVIGTLLAAVLFIKAFFMAIRKEAFALGQRLLPLGVWVSCVALVAAYTYWLNRLELAPNFLRVSDGNGLGFDEFSLKKDGRYIYWSANFLGSSYNYGTYTRHDSIIMLLPNSARNAPKQLTLLIRPYSKLSAPAFTKRSLVYAINQNGQPRNFDSGYQGFHIVELATE